MTTEAGDGELYFFRFRSKDFLDGQWFVGVAGPLPVDGPLQMSGGATFSHFEPWDAKTIQEHIRDYVDD